MAEEDLQEQIHYLLRRLARITELHSRRLEHHFGLTGPQLLALHVLLRDGEMSSCRLARALQLSPPTVTGILDRLERKGLAERTRNRTDRRAVVLRATDAAAEAVAGAPSLLHARFAERLVALSEYEKASIVNVLRQLAAMMSDEPSSPAALLVEGDPSTSPAPDDSLAHRCEQEPC